MSDSIWSDPRITAYALGELPEGERATFESELAGNPELAAAVEEARNVTDQLEGLFANESTPSLDEARRQAITNTPVTANTEQAAAGSWKVPAMCLAMAASLLLLFGLAPWFNQQEVDVTMAKLSRETPQEEEAERVESEELSDSAVALQSSANSLESDFQQTSETESFELLGVASDLGNDEDRTTLKYNANAANGGIAVSAPVAAVPTELSVVERSEARKSKVSENFISGFGRSQTLDEATAEKEVAPQQPPTPAKSESISESISEAPVMFGDLVGGGIVEAPVQVEMVPELGTMVLRGDKEDLQQVEARIKQNKKSAPANTAAASEPGDPFSGAMGGGSLGERHIRAKSLSDLEAKGRQYFEFNGETARYRGGYGLPTDTTDVDGMVNSLGRPIESQASDFSVLLENEAEGQGPGQSGDKFDPITDNPFRRVSEHSLSTFSIDVDTASYSKARDFLNRANQLPRPDAVRIEEMLNYFDYDYAPPTTDDDHPFAARMAVASCPWNKKHRLARIALKGKVMDQDERPRCNLVFLIDTSGSMNSSNKLPLVLDGMQMLLKQLDKDDRVAVTVYAGSAGLVLDSTPAKKAKKIRKALTELKAGGSTNGGAGIALAYATARDNFIADGVNRVILCTDGDFNVGVTGTDSLVRMVEQEAKGGVFLSVLGFGMGNHNDAMLEQISGKGNGNYAYIDNRNEARKVLVEQANSTLVTIAKDVKIQVEFNAKEVSAYRLIGYENRMLAKEDFKDDKKDAGEIGAGHAVTAFYEIVPAGVEADAIAPDVDDLKYQTVPEPTEAAESGELLTLKLRYKQPDEEESKPMDIPIKDDGGKFGEADDEFRFAAAVASFGMQLRRSNYVGSWTMSDVIRVAEKSKGEDKFGLRSEFIDLVRKAADLMGRE